MSINKRVPVTRAIINAVEETDPVFINKKPLLHRWAIKAVGMIGHTNLYERKSIVRAVNDCKIELPENAAHVNGIIIGDWGNECTVFADTTYYRKSEMNYLGCSYVFKWSKDNDLYSVTPFPWTIRDNNITLDCDINGEYVTIDMLLHVLDSDGIPLMNENDDLVVENYIKLKLVEMERFNKFRKGRLTHVDMGYARELKIELGVAIKNAKAKDDYTADVHKEFVSQMVHFPLSGPGYLNLL